MQTKLETPRRKNDSAKLGARPGVYRSPLPESTPDSQALEKMNLGTRSTRFSSYAESRWSRPKIQPDSCRVVLVVDAMPREMKHVVAAEHQVLEHLGPRGPLGADQPYHLDPVLAQILVHGVERLEGVGDLMPLALGAGERGVGGRVGDHEDAEQPPRRGRRLGRRGEGGAELPREATAGPQEEVRVLELGIVID